MKNPSVESAPQSSPWRVPALLLALSAIPLAAGAARLIGLAGATEVTPENARFFAAPVPAVLHIVGASGWSILGAFQFSSSLRRRSPRWHRAAGRILVPLGLFTAFSGLWLSWFYPLVGFDGPALRFIRLVVGTAMAGFVGLGFAAIRRRELARHRVWMVRAYALALGAGTQVLTHLPFFLFEGIQSEASRTLSMAAGWGINLAVAEWVIRRRPVPQLTAPASPGPLRADAAP